MKPEPPVSIILANVPVWLDQRVIENRIKSCPNLIRVRSKQVRKNFQFNLILDFEPGTDAFASLQTTKSEPWISIDHIQLPVEEITENYSTKGLKIVSKLKPLPPSSDPLENLTTRYSLKFADFFCGQLPECNICRDDLDKPLFSTPCWECRNPECYDCVRKTFTMALEDFESFPAKCCGIAFHPDVAKGILPENEFTKYKTRFQERSAKNPIYCPVPTCSAFIPYGIVNKSEITEINCHACQTPICVVCKQFSHTGQPCRPEGGNSQEVEILKKFGYKKCPKCGTAVGKMHGCSHVQCKCGAHWCWDCRRKIETCNMYPCEDAIDEAMNHPGASMMSSDSETETDSEVEGQEVNVDDHAAESRQLDTNQILHASIEDPEPQMGSEVSQASSTDRTINTARRRNNAPFAPRLVRRRTDTPDLPFDDRMDWEPTGIPMTNSEPSTEQGANVTAAGQTDAATAENVDSVSVGESFITHSSPSNLDDPDLEIWEAGQYDFGDEPDEDDPLDTWGCTHMFESDIHNEIPRHWMTAAIPDWWERDASEWEVECMVCWKPTKVAPRPGGGESSGEVGGTKRKGARDGSAAERCGKCGIIVCRRCKNDLARDQLDE